MTSEHQDNARRRFLGTVTSGAALALTGCATGGGKRPTAAPASREAEEVSPGEDLMREHGVLESILLIYEECTRRLEGDAPAPSDALRKSAGIVRRFIEDYHERLEEEFLFPRFEAAGRESELCATLRLQHARGRALTDRIIALGPRGDERAKLAGVLRSFSRMFRPHAAREDTVLFPAFRELVGAAAYRQLGEDFEEREHALFGEHGFGDIVQEVAGLEQTLGIHDLAQFTAAADDRGAT
jgi:hemerythrin-like domain-containing protein